MAENQVLENTAAERADNSWKIRVLVIGAVIGALTGLGTAFMLTKRAEQSGKPLAITTGKGLKLGTMLVGLVQQVLHLGDD